MSTLRATLKELVASRYWGQDDLEAFEAAFQGLVPVRVSRLTLHDDFAQIRQHMRLGESIAVRYFTACPLADVEYMIIHRDDRNPDAFLVDRLTFFRCEYDSSSEACVRDRVLKSWSDLTPGAALLNIRLRLAGGNLPLGRE